MDRTLPGDTTPGQCGPGSDGTEGVLCIPQNSNITGTSLYVRHSILPLRRHSSAQELLGIM